LFLNEGVSQSHPSSRGKPFQSKLETFADLIRDLRRRRKSYREIAEVLRDEHGVVADRTTIWNFVKVRSKPRHVFTMAEEPSSTPPGKPSSDPIAALKAKPVPEPKKPLFIFDENKPLTLKTEQL
jgi:hypothetical protein